MPEIRERDPEEASGGDNPSELEQPEAAKTVDEDALWKSSHAARQSEDWNRPVQEHHKDEKIRVVDPDGTTKECIVVEPKYEEGTWKYKLKLDAPGPENLYNNGAYVREDDVATGEP